VIQQWFEKHREMQRRRSEEGFDGFTLIELLIVIVVLGILAAVVIFALSGVTGQSKASSCNADAKSVETAVEAYRNSPLNTTNAFPTTMTDLTAPKFGSPPVAADPFLRTAPANNNGYKITLDGTADGKVQVSVGGGTATDYDANNLCNTLG
jgi:general secretion pathway protein G